MGQGALLQQDQHITFADLTLNAVNALVRPTLNNGSLLPALIAGQSRIALQADTGLLLLDSEVWQDHSSKMIVTQMGVQAAHAALMLQI